MVTTMRHAPAIKSLFFASSIFCASCCAKNLVENGFDPTRQEIYDAYATLMFVRDHSNSDAEFFEKAKPLMIMARPDHVYKGLDRCGTYDVRGCFEKSQKPDVHVYYLIDPSGKLGCVQLKALVTDQTILSAHYFFYLDNTGWKFIGTDQKHIGTNSPMARIQNNCWKH